MILFLALLIGIVAGYRAMMAPAFVAFAARFGDLHLTGTPLAFMGYAWTPWIFGIAAIGELITDKLPSTPSRRIPLQFGTRIIMGALSGACVGATDENLVGGLIAGVDRCRPWHLRRFDAAARGWPPSSTRTFPARSSRTSSRSCWPSSWSSSV